MTTNGEFTCDPYNFQVTPDMLKSYEDLGYFLVRGFLSKEEVAKIKEAVDHERYLGHGFLVDAGDGKKQCRKVMWRYPGSDVVGMLTRSHKLAGTCERVLGGEIYHYHTKLMTKAARTGGEQFWHQDYGYWYKNGCLFPDMMSVFIPIDKCGKENGCLEVLEGSHKCGRIEHDMREGQTGADMERVKEIRKMCPHRCVEMEAGDALFFHCNLLHGSGKNVSDQRRWVLIPCYNRKTNDAVYDHQHPHYTPLEQVPDSAILTCDVMDDVSDKEFNKPGEDKTSQ